MAEDGRSAAKPTRTVFSVYTGIIAAVQAPMGSVPGQRTLSVRVPVVLDLWHDLGPGVRLTDDLSRFSQGENGSTQSQVSIWVSITLGL